MSPSQIVDKMCLASVTRNQLGISPLDPLVLWRRQTDELE
jgi:hypothetical protein